MKRRRIAEENLDMLESLEEDIVTDDILDEEIINDEFTAEEEVEDDVEEIEEDIDSLDEDDDVEASLFASEEVPGIEDDITDTALGGDPTVQEVVEQGSEAKKEVSDDSEVFPTNSEYVASIVKRLDKIATYLEKTGRKKLAFRIDKISDALESKKI